MEHQETVKILPGAEKAVLFLHGIAGTPEHFRKVLALEELVPESWSVYNLRLDGHGGCLVCLCCSRNGYLPSAYPRLEKTLRKITCESLS